MAKRWVSPRFIAEYLDCSYRTVLRMIRAGELRSVKIRGSLKIDLFTLEQNLEARAEKNASKYNII